jgi:bifunctional pyridoxal-dependent enzyme with beta-cystathionase and maltose regulon repressor activities
MFMYGPMDQTAQRLFEKAGVVWTKGSTLGTDDGFARFNLGQDRDIIREAVRSVIRSDQRSTE